MSRAVKWIWLSVGIALCAGAVFLSTWGIPAPTHRQTIPIPVDQFLKNPSRPNP